MKVDVREPQISDGSAVSGETDDGRQVDPMLNESGVQMFVKGGVA